MRWTKCGVAALGVLLAFGCGKSEAKKLEEIRSCSAITMDAKGAANCLVLQYKWNKDAALTAAQRYQRGQDSTAQFRADSGWRADAARHVREIKQCAADPSGEVARCLAGYGWAAARAKATDDSVWSVSGGKHRREIGDCARRKGMQAGACLQLYYKWSPDRALALDDSIRRAHLKR
jgi:hypothetical protein